MKRILAALKKMQETAKADRQLKRCYRALDIVKDNALDEIDKLELKKSKLMEKLSEVTDYDYILQQLADYMGQQEEQQAIIDRAEKVRTYLDEDIRVEE